MYRPKIALMGSLTESKKMISVNMDYLRAVWQAGGVGTLLPMEENEHLIDEFVEEFDGFLFCGGVDIDPKYYNEPKDERKDDKPEQPRRPRHHRGHRPRGPRKEGQKDAPKQADGKPEAKNEAKQTNRQEKPAGSSAQKVCIVIMYKENSRV